MNQIMGFGVSKYLDREPHNILEWNIILRCGHALYRYNKKVGPLHAFAKTANCYFHAIKFSKNAFFNNKINALWFADY